MENQAFQNIQLPDQDSEMDRLSNAIRDFHNRFGNIEWKDTDRIESVIAVELHPKAAGDVAYQNALSAPNRQNARIAHDGALERAMIDLLANHTELWKQFSG